MKLGQVWHFADVATPRTEKQRSRSRGQGVGLNYESKKCMSPNVWRITLERQAAEDKSVFKSR